MACPRTPLETRAFGARQHLQFKHQSLNQLDPPLDDVASDDVVMSDDAIRTDDLCEEKYQSETETEGSSSSDANRFEKVFVTCVI